jgi:multiple sugar transport system permease protein
MKHVQAAKKLFTWNSKKSDAAFGYALLFPAMFVLAMVVFYPIAKGIVMSFFDYTFFTLKNPEWNNFKNYSALFKDGLILLYLKNTAVYAGGTVVIELIIAMTIALLLNTKMRSRNFLRGAFLLPWTVPTVVVSILWAWLFQPQFGLVNYFLRTFGIIRENPPQWLANPRLAMSAIMIASIWKQTPYMIVMILAGLQNVRTDLIEAASLDGAKKPQLFIYVILPSIKTVLGTTIMVAVLGAFQQFTITNNMTGGGPLNATTTLSIAAYKAAFTKYDMGLGSAIGVIWLVILTTITGIFNVKSKRFDE